MLNALILAALGYTGATAPAPALGNVPAVLWAVQKESDGTAAPDKPQKSAKDKKHDEEVKGDVEAGKKYAKQVDEQFKASTNEEMIRRVQRIGAEMAAIANRTTAKATWGDKKFSQFDYTFKVVQGKDVNAFSLPGGYIYIYEGAVDYCESDDELAGILAHEIAHAAFRHVATMQAQASKIQAIQIPAVILAILVGGTNAGVGVLQTTSLINQAYTSGWSVQAEEAADYGGFQYMTQSRYDPSGMVTIQERLARDEHSRPLGFDLGIYRTHPPSRERVDSLTHYMQVAGVPLRRSQVTTSFRTQVKPEKDVAELWFNGRKLYTFAGPTAQKRAEEASNRLDAFFDSVPEMFQVKSTDDGTILGDKKRLIDVEPEDAAYAKKSVQDLAALTAKNIRGSLYTLAYRIFDAR